MIEGILILHGQLYWSFYTINRDDWLYGKLLIEIFLFCSIKPQQVPYNNKFTNMGMSGIT